MIKTVIERKNRWNIHSLSYQEGCIFQEDDEIIFNLQILSLQ